MFYRTTKYSGGPVTTQEDVWKTVQGCVQAIAFTGTERDSSIKLGSTPSTSEANRTNEQGSLELSENTIDRTDNNNSLFLTSVTPGNRGVKSNLQVYTSSKNSIHLP